MMRGTPGSKRTVTLVHDTTLCRAHPVAHAGEAAVRHPGPRLHPVAQGDLDGRGAGAAAGAAGAVPHGDAGAGHGRRLRTAAPDADRKRTRLHSSHSCAARMPSSSLQKTPPTSAHTAQPPKTN